MQVKTGLRIRAALFSLYGDGIPSVLPSAQSSAQPSAQSSVQSSALPSAQSSASPRPCTDGRLCMGMIHALFLISACSGLGKGGRKGRFRVAEKQKIVLLRLFNVSMLPHFRTLI